MNTKSSHLTAAERISHVKPLATLDEKVLGPHTAVIVIDVQNDFCAEQGTMAKEGFDVTDAQAMATRLPPFLATARSAGALVVFERAVIQNTRSARAIPGRVITMETCDLRVLMRVLSSIGSTLFSTRIWIQF